MHCKITRIAPTPSGYLHIGNIVSFAYTSALALHTGAKILLRIDDMDQLRKQPEYVTDIFTTLKWLDIEWNAGPVSAIDFENRYSQHHRTQLYNKYLEHLAAHNLVFACTCSRSQILKNNANGYYQGNCLHQQLPLDTPGAAWRLKTNNLPLTIKNGSLEESVLLPDEMKYFIVRKKDGVPAYQLTSVADDLHFGVDLIVRGLDLYPSTLAQLQLAKLLGEKKFADNTFFHHQLITNKRGEKLSKSAGAESIQFMRHNGLKPADVMQSVSELIGVPKSTNWKELVIDLAKKIEDQK